MLKDRFCVLRHQVLGPPLCLSNTIVQRHCVHSDISTKRHLHPSSLAQRLCLKNTYISNTRILCNGNIFQILDYTEIFEKFIMKDIKIKQRRLNINMKTLFTYMETCFFALFCSVHVAQGT